MFIKVCQILLFISIYNSFLFSFQQFKPELAQLLRWMIQNQEVSCLNLDTAIGEKSACTVGQGTLPKVVLDNDRLLSLDYEYGNGALEYVKHS